MIEITSDTLKASFPELPGKPVLTIDFQRTLRIPDDGRDYPLPPGFGSFPLRHIDDHAARVPSNWLQRGGVLLPMWQAEALWLKFSSSVIPDRDCNYPFAIKVATGKISAITGKKWEKGLSINPQNYLVAPEQPWLDGYCVEKGLIRQFVAMPLGQGYSVEEQLTGAAEFGGMQIEIFPMRREVFERKFPADVGKFAIAPSDSDLEEYSCGLLNDCVEMGLAPGGRMRQTIYEDPHSIQDWDIGHGSRCFIHLVNSATWQAITGTRPPTQPPTARQYSDAGFPWFDYYDAESKALDGSKTLAGVKSVKEKGLEQGLLPLPENESVLAPKVIDLRAGLAKGQVRETDF